MCDGQKVFLKTARKTENGTIRSINGKFYIIVNRKGNFIRIPVEEAEKKYVVYKTWFIKRTA